MISNKTIEDVRNLDIADVLKPYVELSHRGSSLMGCCPFHNERNPSFSVSSDKGLYHCFTCHKSGDAINFVMEKEGLNFFEAVEFIAKNNNVQIEYNGKEQSDEQKKDAQLRESLFAVYAIVHEFFLSQLLSDSDEASHARNYTYNRWDKDFCDEVGIGYAPKSIFAFIDFCKSKAIDMDLLLQVGLLSKSDKGNLYSMFSERIMIPIRDKFRRIIGYTARYIGANEKIAKSKKYVNSSNSILFQKKETVFGIDKASKCKNKDYFIVVEGAPDVLRLQSIGLDNAVSTLGTAWSDAQFEILKKYSNALCFIPDADPPKDGQLYGPGILSVMENGKKALHHGFDVTVRELPFAKIQIQNTDSELTNEINNENE